MRFSGKVGIQFDMNESAPDVWEPSIIEVDMRGDILRSYQPQRLITDGTNLDLELNHRISLIGNPLVSKNLHNIKYIVLDGVKWRVQSVEHQRPRFIITLGGVYHD